MADTRFFNRAGPYTLRALAQIGGAELAAGTDGEQTVDDVAPLESAAPGHITFLGNRKYLAAFTVSRAGACLIPPGIAERAPAAMGLLIAADPYRAYAKVARAFYPEPPLRADISPRAVIDPNAVIGADVVISAGAVIGTDVEIGDRTSIGANVVLGRGVVIGSDCRIGANVTISHAILGCRVVLYPGVRVGQDGFGYAMSGEGHLKVPQLGRVLVEDDVEIGANATIDRGAGPDTIIGAGSKIDNLVQIGHNVQLGRGCIVVAQSGLSGSTHLGNFVVLGGQVGVTGHLRIGDGARLAAQSGVMRDVGPGETVGGSPAVPMTEWLRQAAALGRLVRKKDR